jgi:hypothetical protein
MNRPDQTPRARAWTRHLLLVIGLAMLAVSVAGYRVRASATSPAARAAPRAQLGTAAQWTEQRPAADADHDVGPGEAEPVLAGSPEPPVR